MPALVEIPMIAVFAVTALAVVAFAVFAYKVYARAQALMKPELEVALKADTSKASGEFKRMAAAVNQTIAAIKANVEAEQRWRDWLYGVEIRWWHPTMLSHYRPYDQEDDDK